MNKIFKGLVIALVVAAVTWAEQTVPSVDFGQYQLIAVAVNSALVNAVRIYLKGKGYTV
jgi:hypothetical protein